MPERKKRSEDAVVDLERWARQGAPEVILGQGKTLAQVIEIGRRLRRAGQPVLVTRCEDAWEVGLKRAWKGVRCDPVSRCAWWGGPMRRTTLFPVAVVAAGTSDLPVAEEAAFTAEFYGMTVQRIYDVGVAGLHRLLARVEDIGKTRAVIVVAGMEGALPSVVAGLVRQPVIAVPTSVGYGTHFGGLSALLGMLNSCGSGVTVVNIDNGFGAAFAVLRMANGNIFD
ncbi:MAG: nickel pincer cofactor biosynthesis protein LarB [Candidatus Methylacidiphilales bacterium]